MKNVEQPDKHSKSLFNCVGYLFIGKIRFEWKKALKCMLPKDAVTIPTLELRTIASDFSLTSVFPVRIGLRHLILVRISVNKSVYCAFLLSS